MNTQLPPTLPPLPENDWKQDTERDEPMNPDIFPARLGLNVWVTLEDPKTHHRTEARRNSILYRVFRSHGWKEVGK